MGTTTTYSTYTAPRSRPILVSILAILVGIYGFIVVLLGLFLLVGNTLLSSFGGASFLGYTGYVAGAIVLIVGLIILGVAVGLWHLRVWALVIALLFLLLEMVVYGLAHAFLSFQFIVSLILFIYLLAVSRHFF
jgi:hypothetical protein